MGLHRKHVYRRRALSVRPLAPSPMAAALVRRHALRLHLSARPALRNRSDFQAHTLLAGQGLPFLHRPLVRHRDRRSLPADARRHRLARLRLVGGGLDILDVAHISFHAALSRGCVVAASAAPGGARQVRRRPAHERPGPAPPRPPPPRLGSPSGGWRGRTPAPGPSRPPPYSPPAWPPTISMALPPWPTST